MIPNPADMLVFLEVVDARSFTGAADQLGRTKSAVSQTISRLEDDLGCKLLYRSTRLLSLTEAGSRFYAHCKELRHTYENALADIGNATSAEEGTLTVTAPHALSAALLVPAIMTVTQNFPKLKIRLWSADAAINLAEARIDVAIRVGDPKLQGARASKLGDIRESLYASPSYVENQSGFPRQLADLASWDHIANDWQGNPVSYNTPSGQHLRVKPKIRCNTMPDVRHLAITGAGVALLPDLTVRDALDAGQLVTVMPLDTSPVFAIHEYGRHPPKKVTAFIEIIRTAMKASEN